VLAVIVALIAGAWLDNQISPATKIQNLELSTSQTDNGLLIHLLMDGFTGPEGLPITGEAKNLKSEILNLFRKYGFQIFTRAYTHYSSTMDSMTRALNFRNDDENIWQRALLLREPITFPENQWFDILSDAGYNVVVYQTAAVDFCAQNGSKNISCNVFSSPNLKSIHTDVANPYTRVRVLLETLAAQSEMITEMRKKYGLYRTWGVSNYDEQILQRLIQDIQIQPQGAYFAHILLPHAPLVFRPDCTIDYESESWERWPASGGLLNNSDETRRIRYTRIVPQMQCALTVLDAFFTKLKDLGLFEDATIIVHGDHGGGAFNFSPSVLNMDKMSERDLREIFSMLFAVKYPGGEFEVNDDVTSLNILMANTAQKITGKSMNELNITVQSEDEPFIYLSDQHPLKRGYVNIFSRKSESGQEINNSSGEMGVTPK
jgi:hypothetical protein